MPQRRRGCGHHRESLQAGQAAVGSSPHPAGLALCRVILPAAAHRAGAERSVPVGFEQQPVVSELGPHGAGRLHRLGLSGVANGHDAGRPRLVRHQLFRAVSQCLQRRDRAVHERSQLAVQLSLLDRGCDAAGRKRADRADHLVCEHAAKLILSRLGQDLLQSFGVGQGAGRRICHRRAAHHDVYRLEKDRLGKLGRRQHLPMHRLQFAVGRGERVDIYRLHGRPKLSRDRRRHPKAAGDDCPRIARIGWKWRRCRRHRHQRFRAAV